MKVAPGSGMDDMVPLIDRVFMTGMNAGFEIVVDIRGLYHQPQALAGAEPCAIRPQAMIGAAGSFIGGAVRPPWRTDAQAGRETAA